MRCHVNTSPRHPLELNASLPLMLCATIVKAMEKDPAARYQTAAEFAADLEDVSYDEAQTIAQMSIVAPTIPSFTPSGKPPSGSGTPRPGSDPARPSKVSAVGARFGEPRTRSVYRAHRQSGGEARGRPVLVGGRAVLRGRRRDRHRERSRAISGGEEEVASSASRRCPLPLLLQHLQRFRQTHAHPVERASDVGDFVAAFHLKIGQFGFAFADAVCRLRNLVERSNHDKVERGV